MDHPNGTRTAHGMGHHQSFDAARGHAAVASTRKSMPSLDVGTPTKMRAKDRALKNDFQTPEAFDIMLNAWFHNLAVGLKPGGSFYIWGGYANRNDYPAVLKAEGLYFSQGIIWNKNHPVLTRKDFMGAHEEAYYGWKEGAAHYFNKACINMTTVWSVTKVASQAMVHLTEKPVELARLALLCSSKPGDAILDLFGGSGSTMMACEEMGRDAFLMELDEAYCDVIVERWENATGQKATRVRAG